MLEEFLPSGRARAVLTDAVKCRCDHPTTSRNLSVWACRSAAPAAAFAAAACAAASASLIAFAAKYAGALGNSLEVSMADADTFGTWDYKSQFTGAPGTSTYAANKGGSDDELHIVVVDEDGLISGVPGTILEKFAGVSKAFDAKDDSGNSSYYKNVITAQSQYIRWLSHPATANLGSGTAWGSTANATTFKTILNVGSANQKDALIAVCRI